MKFPGFSLLLFHVLTSCLLFIRKLLMRKRECDAFEMLLLNFNWAVTPLPYDESISGYKSTCCFCFLFVITFGKRKAEGGKKNHLSFLTALHLLNSTITNSTKNKYKW